MPPTIPDPEISREEMQQRLRDVGIEVDISGNNITIFDRFITSAKTRVLDYLNFRSGAQQESRAARQYREQWNELHKREIEIDPILELLPDTRRDTLPGPLCSYVIDLACGDYVSAWLCIPNNLKQIYLQNKYVASVTNGRTSHSYGLNPAMQGLPGFTSLVATWSAFPYEALAPYRKLHRELEYMHPEPPITEQSVM
jgi:hypothetical protein